MIKPEERAAISAWLKAHAPELRYFVVECFGTSVYARLWHGPGYGFGPRYDMTFLFNGTPGR